MYDVLILYMYYAGRKRYVDIFTSKYLTKHVTSQNKLNCANDDYIKMKRFTNLDYKSAIIALQIFSMFSN